MAPSIVKRYIIAFGKYKFAGFAVFALAVGVSGLMGLEEPPPPSYNASGVMSLNQEPVTVSQTGPNIQEQGKQALNREFLLDDQVVEQVAEQVGVHPRQIRSAQLRTPGSDGPQLYTISFVDATPERAKQVVQLLMESSVEKSRMLNTSRLDVLIAALNERIPEVESDLREAEENLLQFDRIDGAALILGRDGVLVGNIRGAQNRQDELQRQIEETTTQMQSLEARLGLTVDEAYTSSALSRDPIVNNLRGQIHQIESQQALLSQTLREDHPQVVELRRQLAGLERLLENRAQEVIGGDGIGQPLYDSRRVRTQSSLDPTRQEMANQLVGLQTQREMLLQNLVQSERLENELLAEYQNLPNLELERERLSQIVAIHKSLFNQLQARLIDAESARTETVSNLSIAQEPQVQEIREEAANIFILVLIGGGAGLAAGAVLIFGLSALEGRFYTMEEVRGALQERDLTVLGTIPHVDRFDTLDEDPFPVLLSPHSPYLDYYERLRSNLQRIEGKPPRIVLVTSPAAQEGKSFTAYNLAIAAARAGKRTLLVEADVRSHSQAESLKIALDPARLTDPLKHYHSLNQNAHLVPDVPNLYVASSPGPQRNAPAVIESSELRQLLMQARARFDFVVVDSPALSECNDTLALEPFTDGLLIVARPGVTRGGLLNEYAEMLEEAEDRVRVLGSVVNGAEVPVEIPYDESEEPAVEERLGYEAALYDQYLGHPEAEHPESPAQTRTPS
ncbi:GumC family protein [Sodalinema gerasimenkoae]|uniref:GumC family protein n=1 Tax=Sodalinema gerasimenkoae TaxID=2862348 RepID=UPI001359B9E2|nr:tyrosine-protein kinase domain-containing protein [Sodalinema gerasimenkoae]